METNYTKIYKQTAEQVWSEISSFKKYEWGEGVEPGIIRCHENGQQQPTPLILKYGVGGFNTLHQDLYVDVYFPIHGAV